jgi:hypothetical protein
VSGLELPLALMLFCSGATTRPPVPAEMKMNKDAGRGIILFVPLGLKNGEELPFVLDTGASGTCLDQSLVPKLGRRFDTGALWHFGNKHDAGVFAAPKLYLGGCLLQMTGSNVFVDDFKPLASEIGHPVMGILGMDVLEHYCLQLDFAAHRVRFLHGKRVNKRVWGKAYSLTDVGMGCEKSLHGSGRSRILPAQT